MGVRVASALWSSSLIRLGATCAFLVCILLTLPTRADDAQNSALARSLFNEGVSASDRGEWRLAVDKFSRAYALRASPALAFNLASAELEIGQIVRAAEHLRAVLNDASSPAELRERSRLVLEEIAPRIAFVTVGVQAPSRDFELRVDGVTLPAQAWGAATPVDPGEHVFDLVQADHVHDSHTVLVREGERASLTLSARVLGPVAAHPTAAPPAPEAAPAPPSQAPTQRSDVTSEPRRKRWLVWGSVGLAVAAGATVAIVLATRDGGEKSEAAVMGNTSEGVIRW